MGCSVLEHLLEFNICLARFSINIFIVFIELISLSESVYYVLRQVPVVKFLVCFLNFRLGFTRKLVECIGHFFHIYPIPYFLFFLRRDFSLAATFWALAIFRCFRFFFFNFFFFFLFSLLFLIFNCSWSASTRSAACLSSSITLDLSLFFSRRGQSLFKWVFDAQTQHLFLCLQHLAQFWRSQPLIDWALLMLDKRASSMSFFLCARIQFFCCFPVWVCSAFLDPFFINY